MHFHSEHLHLSPSDVTAFLACEHLTTLSLAHARGEIERPEVENEQAELIFRKGLEHERAYLEHLRARREHRPRDPRPATATTKAPPARPPTRSAPARPTSSTRASSPTSDWRGVADFLLPPAGRHLRGARHQARALRQARLHPPAPLLQRAARADPGARADSRSTSSSATASRRPSTRASSPPTTGASARGSSSFVADPPPTEPYPVDHCVVCDFKAVCDACWDEVDHLTRVAGVYRTQIEKLAAAGITTLAQLGRAPAEPVPAGINPDTLGEEPRAGRAPAARARDRRRHLPAAAAAAGSRLRAPARPLARRPLLRLRGQPVLGRGRLARVPLGDPRRRRQLHAAPRARPRHRADQAFEHVRRPRPRAAARATPTCTSTTTPPTRSPRSSG